MKTFEGILHGNKIKFAIFAINPRSTGEHMCYMMKDDEIASDMVKYEIPYEDWENGDVDIDEEMEEKLIILRLVEGFWYFGSNEVAKASNKDIKDWKKERLIRELQREKKRFEIGTDEYNDSVLSIHYLKSGVKPDNYQDRGLDMLESCIHDLETMFSDYLY